MQTINRHTIADTLNTSTMFKMAAHLAQSQISQLGLSRMFRDAIIIKVSQQVSYQSESYIKEIAERTSEILSYEVKPSTCKTVIYRHSIIA